MEEINAAQVKYLGPFCYQNRCSAWCSMLSRLRITARRTAGAEGFPGR